MPHIKLTKRLVVFSFLGIVSLLLIVITVPKIILAGKCDQYDSVLDNQCDSLRPFPGVTPSPKPNSPPTSTAAMCGNSVVIIDEIKVTPSQAVTCQKDKGVATCYFTSSRKVNLTLDISESELPIMGNTEDVVNLQSTSVSGTLTDAERINNYVSWYLNGTINRAEYPFTQEGEEATSVNFAGPTRKILPQESQYQAEINTIKRANLELIDNQVVACIGAFGVPIPCYKPLLSNPQIAAFIKIKNLKDWNGNIPPLRQEYPNFISYYLDYRTWRGDRCASFTIPIVNFSVFLCFDDPTSVNYWSNLFPYIPFSSTEDKQGLLTLGGSVPLKTDDMVISNVDFKSIPSDLYFAHMQESKEVSALLQATFTSKDAESGTINDLVSPKIDPGCKILQTRTNAGDNLFGQTSKPEATMKYDVAFKCLFDLDSFGGYKANASCTKKPAVTFTVSVKTPLANDVFSQLVAGSNSIVRRIFPKLGMDSKLGSMFDMPASTNVKYITASGSGNIYFPHIGAVNEYFMKGIQTLLRPKGYGEQVTFAAPGHQYSSCGTGFAQFNPPGGTTDKARSYFEAYIKPNLTDEVMSAYAEAERVTGVPCEVLAGVHHMEASNDPTRDLQSGGSLAHSGKSLTQSAIDAADAIRNKVGGKIESWDDLITALSYYNGGGNSNCGMDSRYNGPCAPPSGMDDPYPMAWIDSGHEEMYLIFCEDYTKCPTPFPYFDRPGALAVAIEVYLAKIR